MIDELLAAARARIDRVRPEDLDRELAAGALVVDTRPLEQRQRDGDLPGAVVVDRNVLEWRLDPASPHRIPETAYDRRIVVVCNEGYSSSLAAATLVDLRLTPAADLIGGFRAYAGLGSLGSPSTRSPTMLRWISAVPPQIVSEREKKNEACKGDTG